MNELIDQIMDLLVRIETDPAKARFLIGRVMDRAYQLDQLIRHQSDQGRLLKYVSGRLYAGNSGRQVARELGWGREKLYAFCERHGIARPRRKKTLV